jgi:hypothetical protein
MLTSTLNATLDKLIFNSIFIINHNLNHLVSNNINTTVSQDSLISIAAPEGVKLELQLPKLPFSAEQEDDGFPYPRDHDPFPANQTAAVQVRLLSAEQAQISPPINTCL